MAKVTVPTLRRENGWVVYSSEIMLKIFEYFLTSEYSQSNMYFNNISSLKYILRHAQDTDGLREELESTLTTLYKRYFPVATVTVTADESKTDVEITYNIDIEIQDADGVVKTLSRDIDTTKNNIVNLNSLLANINIK